MPLAEAPRQTLLPCQLRKDTPGVVELSAAVDRSQKVPSNSNDAYRAVGLTREDLERGHYVQMNQLQRLLDARTGKLFAPGKASAEGNSFPINSDESVKTKAFS
jgi:hypothetical protein